VSILVFKFNLAIANPTPLVSHSVTGGYSLRSGFGITYTSYTS